MANRPAPALVLREGDREELSRLTRSSSVRAGLAQRARIVLLAADGVSNTRDRGAGRGVAAHGDRVAGSVSGQRGLAGLEDEQRPGRPRSIDHAAIVTATLSPPPKKLGVTHWSTRLLARHLGISDATVATAWRDYGVKPWRVESFRFSTDPELVAKVVDIVGLYLAPPENAIVLSVDEKSQIQALDRTMPILPMQPGLVERRSHDYIRHGTTTLFAALEIVHREGHRRGQATAPAPGVPGLPQAGRPRLPRGQQLHLVMDNYAAHKHPNVRDWLAAATRASSSTSPRPTPRG